jgi:hypothetical protein
MSNQPVCFVRVEPIVWPLSVSPFILGGKMNKLTPGSRENDRLLEFSDIPNVPTQRKELEAVGLLNDFEYGLLLEILL